MYETKKIAKGEVRIGRRYPSAFDDDSIAVNWFHCKCIFSQQLRARQSTQVIERESDIDGFHDLLLGDKQLIRELIQGNIDLRFDNPLPNAKRTSTGAEGRLSSGGISKTAPSSRMSEGPTRPGSRQSLSSPKPKPKPRDSVGRRDNGRILML